MNEEEVRKKTFKMFGFKEFPMSELKKIDEALNQIGYSGEVTGNGNLVYTKKSNIGLIKNDSNKK